MASALSRDEISKLLDCAICLEMVKNPRRLACEHFFCKRCLDKLLIFNPDGSCIIKCPKRCKKDTYISKTGTTNDLGVDYLLNGMVEMVASNNGSLDLMTNAPSCNGNTSCSKNVSFYCPSCNSFICRSCSCSHDKNQYFPVSYDSNEEKIKVSCQKHSSDADYLCCDPCTIDFICMYCIHRGHSRHSFSTVMSQTEHLKAEFQKVIENIKTCNNKIKCMLEEVESDISVARYVLDETLRYRKMLCFTEYLHFLNKEEERLNAEFYDITVNHRKQYHFNEDFNNVLEEKGSSDEVTFALQVKNALNYSSLCDKFQVLEETISLCGHRFDSSNPLGSFNIAKGKHIFINGSGKSFKSRIVNRGDHSMRDDAKSLYENLHCLLQKCIPSNKDPSYQIDPNLFDNLLEENERLKDDMVKLEEQNNKIVAANNNWEEAYGTLTLQYNNLQKQCEENNKNLMNKIKELEEDNTNKISLLDKFLSEVDSLETEEDCMAGTQQEEEAALILTNLSERNEKHKIGEQLLPLVMEREPFNYNYVMDILLQLDICKLSEMVQSPSILAAEVDVAMELFEVRDRKERIARYVERALLKKEKKSMHSFEFVDQNEPQLTLSILESMSVREQKQMIGERLFPLVQQIAPMDFVYIMDILLGMENVKLLSMLESHDILCEEVEKAISYVKQKNVKDKIACYVVKAMAADRN